MAEALQGWKRTCLGATLSVDDVSKEVTLMGWAQRRRDLGSLMFVDLRDRSGIIQIVFDSSKGKELFEKAEKIRNEFVLAIKGTVVLRDNETINENLSTGKIEIKVSELKILSESKTPPFSIEEGAVQDTVRLKYRYLDLRRPAMQKNLIIRHKIAAVTREFLNSEGFLEIETPILAKSTPEGARDYLVPSRVHPGSFYALPQSPQQFKQLLMISGMDRYYQIARCFRDEDLRADRQPEFTQIDMEMSFVEEDDIMDVSERMIAKVFKETIGVDIPLPLKRMKYDEAMDRFGSDKPDTRFGLELKNISDILIDSTFNVFSGAIASGGSVRAVNAKGCADLLARRDIDALVDYVKIYKAKGMAWITITEEGLKSPITKFLTEQEIASIVERLEGKVGDILFFVADRDDIVFDSLGHLRLKLAEKLGLIDDSVYNLLFVTEFPLFEYDYETKTYSPKHHPFTSPRDQDLDIVESDPGKAYAKAYDLVLNGMELGGGSIRIHSVELQQRMFRVLGHTDESIRERFGFLIDAFEYGPPPHGGLAFGLDRIAMILTNSKSIRDVIAFPKVQNASCLMSEAPSGVDQQQLDELCIKVVEKK